MNFVTNYKSHLFEREDRIKVRNKACKLSEISTLAESSSRAFSGEQLPLPGFSPPPSPTYLDQLGVVRSWLLGFQVLSALLLITEEGRHWLFRSILILLDTLLLPLDLDLGLSFLGWGG